MARIDQLISFCRVADLGSFSLAGEDLGISQPTISLQVKSLEEEYGAKLLHREGHKISLNENGQMVYDDLSKIISLFNHSLESVKNENIKLKGVLRIGASSGPGEHPIPLVLAKFKKAYPDSDISLRVGDSNEMMDKVSNQSLELGFVGARRRDGNLIFEPILEDKLILVAAKNSAFSKNKKISLTELKKIPLIIQQPGSGATETLRNALEDINLKITDLNIILQLGLQESVKSAVFAGYGATLISQLGVKNEVRKSELISIEVMDLDLQRDIYLCRNRNFPLSNLAASFVRFFKQSYFDE